MAEDDDKTRNGPDSSQLYGSQIFSMAERALDKLVILNYEEEFCRKRNIRKIPKVYFVLPSPKPNEQWRLFNMLCSWLCFLCTGNEDHFVLEEYDDPQTAANKLVLALKKLDFELDMPANKLKTPFGEATASTLDFLTEKALEKRGFVWSRPVYKEDEVFDTTGGGEEQEEEVIEEDVDPVEDEGENMFSNIVKGQDAENPALEDSHYKILESNIDPMEWKTELERVSTKLKMPSVPVSGNEWRQHIEQTKLHDLRIQQSYPDTKAQLEIIQTEVGEALDKMRSKESYINTQNSHLRTEYEELKGKLKEIESRYRKVSENVSVLTNDLTDLSERLSEIKSVTDDHGQSMTDTSPLVKIKAALQNVKAEIKTFDIRLGVVGHALLQAKLRMQQGKHKRKNKKNDPDHDVYDLETEDYR